MPVELLLWGACKLIEPVAARVRANLEDKVADGITEFAERYARRAIGGLLPGEEAEVEVDTQISEEDEAAAEELEKKFQLTSALPDEREGADASLVRAYEAILWRLAMLASWEERNVAVAGALQGPKWMTLCIPHLVGGVIPPRDIWRDVDGENALRRPFHNVPVEFFVKPLAEGQDPEYEVRTTNAAIRRSGLDLDRPISPGAPAWHRIDGLSAGWVALQPDTETEARLQQEYAAGPGGMLGRRRHFNTSPLTHAEYPNSWHPLINVDDTSGLAALIAGADNLAEDQKKVSDAVEGLLAK